MSAKSRKSAKAIDRPFAPEVWREAQKIANQYQIVLEQQEDGWYGRGLELPRVMADGPTASQCVKNVREALCGAVALMLEQGQRPPAPARTGRRTCQMNIRLLAEERMRLEAAAKRLGFSNMAEFVRTAALEAASK